MSKNNQLEVKNLRKHFISKKSVTNAIDNVSFVVPKGKVVGLIGESGSGKTTIGRSIIRLHVPNSGSVTMDGYEFATKKVSKETRKYLRKNIQMIFQDPYSSLNGQKNIMSIVSEPLIVNGTHKLMLENMLSKRDEVIEFFGFSLKREYLKNYSAYEEFKLSQTKKALTEASKIISEFKQTNDKSSLQNIEEIIGLYFDNLDILKIEVLTHVRDLFNTLLETWEHYKSRLGNDKYFVATEADLKSARELVAKIEKKMSSSDVLEKLEQEQNELEIQVEDIKESHRLAVSSAKKALDEFAREYNAKFLEYRSKASDTTTYGNYNYFNFLALQNKYMLKVIAELRSIKTLSVRDLGELLTKFDNEVFVKCENKVEELISNTTNKKAAKEENNFFNSEFFVELLNKIHADVSKTSIMFNSQIEIDLQKLTTQLDVLNTKIEFEKESIKVRDQSKLEDELQIAKEKVEKCEEANNAARVKYVEDNQKTILIKLDTLTNQTLVEIDGLLQAEKESIKLLTDKISLIEKSFKDSKKSLKNLAQHRRKVRFMLEDRKSKIKQFNIEIKKNENELMIIRRLFNISNSNKSVTATGKASFLDPFYQRSLRSLLVRRKVFKTLVEVGMNESHASRYPHEFSGGMRQRVGIARAIINDPKLIIADEPIAALDLSIQAQVMNLLMRLKKERDLSMIFIAHDLSMIRHNSDYIQIMHLGKIVEHGDTESVFTNPVHPYTKNLIASMPEISEISKGFKGNIFKPEYLKNYSHINVPTYHKLSEGHYVLADESQIIEWTKKKVTPKTSSVAKIESKKEITKKGVKAKQVAKKPAPDKKSKPISKVSKNVKKAKS